MQIGTLFVHSFGMTSTTMFSGILSNLTRNAVPNAFQKVAVDTLLGEVGEVEPFFFSTGSKLRIKALMVGHMMRQESRGRIRGIAELIHDALQLLVLRAESILHEDLLRVSGGWPCSIFAHGVVKSKPGLALSP